MEVITNALDIIGNILTAIVILSGALVFVFREWTAGYINSYFRKKVDKELEGYKHELAKEIEGHKSDLTKALEVHKLALENRKYITKRIIDKRFEIYELIASRWFRILLDLSAIPTFDTLREPYLTEIESIHADLKIISKDIEQYYFYFRIETFNELIAIRGEIVSLMGRVQEGKGTERKDHEIVGKLGGLVAKLQNELFIDLSFSEVNKGLYI